MQILAEQVEGLENMILILTVSVGVGRFEDYVDGEEN